MAIPTHTTRNRELAQLRRVLDKAMSKIGINVAVVLKGKCPVCGEIIDLSQEHPMHHCPSIPRTNGKVVVEFHHMDSCEKAVVIASSAKLGCRLATLLSKEYGIRPILIVPA